MELNPTELLVASYIAMSALLQDEEFHSFHHLRRTTGVSFAPAYVDDVKAIYWRLVQGGSHQTEGRWQNPRLALYLAYLLR